MNHDSKKIQQDNQPTQQNKDCLTLGGILFFILSFSTVIASFFFPKAKEYLEILAMFFGFIFFILFLMFFIGKIKEKKTIRYPFIAVLMLIFLLGIAQGAYNECQGIHSFFCVFEFLFEKSIELIAIVAAVHYILNSNTQTTENPSVEQSKTKKSITERSTTERIVTSKTITENFKMEEKESPHD